MSEPQEFLVFFDTPYYPWAEVVWAPDAAAASGLFSSPDGEDEAIYVVPLALVTTFGSESIVSYMREKARRA